VDRRALARAPAVDPPWQDGGFAAPRTPVEEVVAGIWSELFGVERVGALDDFFALGGHSLLATQVLSRLRAAFGVDLPLERLFQAVTVRELARAVEAAMAAMDAGSGPRLPPIPPRGPGDQDLPLSLAQEPLWALDRHLPGTSFFNVPLGIRLAGALDLPAARSSVDQVVSRHEMLRTTFRAGEQGPLQVVAPAVSVPWTAIDLGELAGQRGESAAEGLAEAERIAAAVARLPFDLATGPLLRVVLLRLGRELHCLLFSIHHIAFDAWSMGVLVREWAALYAGLSHGCPAMRPELPVQYADFAWWQRRCFLDDGAAVAERSYWRERLGDLPPLRLLTDFPRPEQGTFATADRHLVLPRPLSAALARLCRGEGVTLFMTQVAAFAAVLARRTAGEDLRIGTLVANRTRRETEDLIGLFVNTVVLCLDLSAQPTWRQLLRRVRETVLGAFAHQDLPFELVRRDAESRAPGQGPLVDVLVIFQNAPLQPLELPGLAVTSWPDEGDRPAEPGLTLTAFDLVLVMEETEEGLRCLLRYKTRLFAAATIGRMLRDFEAGLEEMVAQHQQPA
jgi:acyl carrier protein